LKVFKTITAMDMSFRVNLKDAKDNKDQNRVFHFERLIKLFGEETTGDQLLQQLQEDKLSDDQLNGFLFLINLFKTVKVR
jgi:hypothetical protein